MQLKEYRKKMSSPKEKARELVSKFFNDITLPGNYTMSLNKECAKITVEEIIKALTEVDWSEVQNLDRSYAYWDNVIEEINKL